jgi:predicted nucleotidyltransferase
MLINPQALQIVVDFLNEHHIPYMLIGGLANAIWGEARTTRDADFKVSVNTSLAEFRKLVFEHFRERATNIPPRLKSAQVLHIWAMPEVAVDLLVGIFDYERQAIERAVETDIEGVPTRVCTAEDLVIHKVIADRAKDWIDIEGVLMRQRGKLDINYIRDWLTQFAEALEKPELLTRFNNLYETT